MNQVEPNFTMICRHRAAAYEPKNFTSRFSVSYGVGDMSCHMRNGEG